MIKRNARRMRHSRGRNVQQHHLCTGSKPMVPSKTRIRGPKALSYSRSNHHDFTRITMRRPDCHMVPDEGLTREPGLEADRPSPLKGVLDTCKDESRSWTSWFVDSDFFIIVFSNWWRPSSIILDIVHTGRQIKGAMRSWGTMIFLLTGFLDGATANITFDEIASRRTRHSRRGWSRC